MSINLSKVYSVLLELEKAAKFTISHSETEMAATNNRTLQRLHNRAKRRAQKRLLLIKQLFTTLQ